MNFQLAFWETEPRLNTDFRDSLKIFYNRIVHVANDPLPMLWSRDIDTLLKEAASRAELQWVCVVGVGTLFPDQDYIAHLIKEAILKINEPVLVMGQLINKKGRYCGLHEQMFMVNLDKYKELGCPAFGNYEHRTLKLKNYVAGESIHDDYTPKELRAAEGYSEFETWTCGWNMVHTSMENNLPIFNLPDKLRNEKIYAYPDDNLDRLNKNLELLYQMDDFENSTQSKLLGYLFNKRFGFNVGTKGSGVQLTSRTGKIFIFNTEFLLPDPIWIERHKKPLDLYLGPCSGFLELTSLYAHGFHSDTRIVYYDLNQPSVQWKKWMLENFDGNLNRLEEYAKRYAAKSYTPCYLGDPPSEIRKLLDVFGTAEEFQRTWQALQALPKEFLQLNLISSGRKLLELIDVKKRTVFAISDIYTGQNELVYGASGIKNRFLNFIDACAGYPELIISGKDVQGTPIINFADRLQAQFSSLR